MPCSTDRSTRCFSWARCSLRRRRLGWEPGILNGDGLKPKGMHWRTFERLQGEHNLYVNAALVGMSARLGLLHGRLGEVDSEMDPWRRR